MERKLQTEKLLSDDSTSDEGRSSSFSWKRLLQFSLAGVGVVCMAAAVIGTAAGTPLPAPESGSAPARTIPTEAVACEDLQDWCTSIDPFWCTEDGSADWQWNSDNCPKTCELCSGGDDDGPTPAPPCQDTQPWCVDVKANNWCLKENSVSWETNQQYCPDTCGICAGKVLTPAPTFAPLALEGTPTEKAEQALPRAQTWVTNAVQKMNAGQGGNLMTKWFGSNDEAFRANVTSTLMSIESVLNGPPHFQTPTDECTESGSLAWVLPGEKDSEGHFIINICEKATNYGCDICVVGTICHEASHHCGTLDYGYDIDVCKGLAASDACSDEFIDDCKALNNAENVAYFLRDINGQL